MTRIDRRKREFVELYLDRCANTFGVAPCTATGTQCFNKRAGCKDPDNYVNTVGGQVLRFNGRGFTAPLSISSRPYLISIDTAPTEIRPGVGLSIRGQQKILLEDEPDNDSELDPYLTARRAVTLRNPGAFAKDSTTYSRFGVKVFPQSTSFASYLTLDYLGTLASGDVELEIAPPASGQTVGIVFRRQSSPGSGDTYSGYRVQYAGGGASITLSKITAGAVTSLGSNSYTPTNFPMLWRVVFNGSTLQVFADGVLKITATDATYSTGAVEFLAASNPTTSPLWIFSVPGPAGGTFFRRLIARDPYMVGRMAKVYRGLDPNAGTLALAGLAAELFVIDKIVGPDRNGRLQVVLSDVLKLADKALEPLPTDGKLLADVAGAMFTGPVVSATDTTVTFGDDASAVDDAYNGAEVLVLTGIGAGAGNRQVIADYVGSSRTATLVGTWAVTPAAGSVAEIVPLSLTLNNGKGSQYRDPVVSLQPEFVRVGDEVIRYTSKSGDVLSWANGSYRAQFGTTRADHKKNDKAQQCTVFDSWKASDVVVYLLRKAAIADSLIDLVGLAKEDDQWFSTAGRVSAQLTTPEKIGDHLKALTYALNLMLWWDPVAQKVKGRVNAPTLAPPLLDLTDANLIHQSTDVDRLDDERVTRVSMDFGLRSATANVAEAKNFLLGKMRIDEDAEDVAAFGPAGIRVESVTSRWLSLVNEVFAEAMVARRLNWKSRAPMRVKTKLEQDVTVQISDDHAFTSLGGLTLRNAGTMSIDSTTWGVPSLKVISQSGSFSSYVTLDYLGQVADATIEVGVFYPGLTNGVGLVFRRQPSPGSGDNFSGYRVQIDTLQLRLFRWTTGFSFVQLGSTAALTPGAAPSRLKVQFDGPTISVYFDDVLKIGPITDATYTTGAVELLCFANPTSNPNWYAGTSVAGTVRSTLLGDLVDLTTRRIVDQFGDQVKTRFRVVKLDQKTEELDVDLLSTNFAGRRWAFIAPTGLPDYSAASDAQRAYAYICRSTGDFANGDDGYLII